MPFLRFSRDKRGYEHFYLVEPATRRGKSRNRILYWFRTPPGVKVGRLPFDDHVRHALETRYPNVAFDWRKLIETPIPPPAPDVERWRERRRLERAAKQAAALEATADRGDAASEERESSPAEPPVRAPAETAVSAAGPESAAGAPVPSSSSRRRRRRSGRRGRTGGGGAVAEANGNAPHAAGSTNPSNGAELSNEAADSQDPDED